MNAMALFRRVLPLEVMERELVMLTLLLIYLLKRKDYVVVVVPPLHMLVLAKWKMSMIGM